MARLDRRRRTALDETYRYYNQIEKGEEADLFALTKAVRTLSLALTLSDTREFKLTQQLWKRLQQVLFDRLINGFPGRISILNEKHEQQEILTPLPASGYLGFRADRCRRTDDHNEIELSRLFPKTSKVVKQVWEQRGAFVKPSDFELADCEDGLCFMKPLLVGHEILDQESRQGRDTAYHKWWELYWEAYCSSNKKEQELLLKEMSEIESIWGNLNY